MPASSAISLVRVAANPFCVNSFRAASLIRSSVDPSFFFALLPLVGLLLGMLQS
jgi:hypothetical protein